MSKKDLTQYIKNLKVNQLNAMQDASLEAFTNQENLLLLSDTGSGKTLAFLLPLLNNLENITETQAVIVVPSRELAQQIESVFKQLKTGYKITACYGGHKREIEENNLIDAPAVIVGTPGRLCDHIRRENIHTSTIKMLFLDEFDKILEFGFAEETKFIFESIKNRKKTMLISATDSAEMPEFIDKTSFETLHFLNEEKEENKLSFEYLITNNNDKTDSLFQLLCNIGNKKSIIFCNHRDAVERVDNFLKEKGIVSVFYHGAMEQQERDTALAKFRNGSASFLITTDLASRGLDISNIRYIIHYHLPPTEAVFTHRNGRTARMDASGEVILLLSPEEKLPDFVDDSTKEISISPNAQLPPKADWVTVYIPLGKKNKVNKIDLVGFFIQQGNLKKEEIGIIEVKDFHSFIALKRNKAKKTVQELNGKRIKNKKAKIDIAR